MIIFTIIWTAWFLSEILINRLFRSPAHGHNELDKGTVRRIWITIFAAIGIGFLCNMFIRLPVSHGLTIPGIGLVLILLGMVLRVFSIRALGPFFTVDVAVQTQQTIKTDGLYRYIRHPAYAGNLLCFVGFGISLNNWVGLLVMVCLVFLAFRHRILLEERVLLDQFGSDYAAYMEHTARLIPGIY